MFLRLFLRFPGARERSRNGRLFFVLWLTFAIPLIALVFLTRNSSAFEVILWIGMFFMLHRVGWAWWFSRDCKRFPLPSEEESVS